MAREERASQKKKGEVSSARKEKAGVDGFELLSDSE